MQAGLPIISTNVGGIPEIVSDQKNGLLLKPADPQILADSTSKLIKNKNLAKQLGCQAKNDVLENFSLLNMIKKTKLIYNF